MPRLVLSLLKVALASLYNGAQLRWQKFLTFCLSVIWWRFKGPDTAIRYAILVAQVDELWLEGAS